MLQFSDISRIEKNMNKEGISWGIMFILGIMLIDIGFMGSLGKVLACIVEPQIIEVKTV